MNRQTTFYSFLRLIHSITMVRVVAVVLLLVLGGVPSINAQQNLAQTHRFFVRAAGSVPHPTSNKAFRRSFVGIYDLTGSVSYRIFSGFNAGAVYKHTLWKTPDNKVPGLNLYGQTNAFGLRVGYDHILTESAVFFSSIAFYSSETYFYGLACAPQNTVEENIQTTYNYRIIEGEMGFYFYTEGNFAIGMQAAFAHTNFNFDPRKVCLDQQKAYIPSDFEGNLTHLNIGVTVVCSFKKARGKE